MLLLGWLIDWGFDQMLACSIATLIGWLFDWLVGILFVYWIVWLVGYSIGCLNNWYVVCFFARLTVCWGIVWFVDVPIDCVIVLLAGWPMVLVECLVKRLFDWLRGCLLARLIDWMKCSARGGMLLIDWLVDWGFDQLIACFIVSVID